MEKQLGNWGNSLAFRIPQALAKQHGLYSGLPVEISSTKEGILIRPKNDPVKAMKAIAAGLDLEAMCASITEENRPDPEEVGWGPPVGREVW